MKLSLWQTYRDFKSDTILVFYYGPMAQSSIEGLGDSLRRNLEFEEASHPITLTVFSMFVEQVQNVLNYSADRLEKNNDPEDETGLRVGLVTIGREGDHDYFVFCGNPVYKEDEKEIKAHLEHLNSLDAVELKSLYKEQRRRERREGESGAGLGLIEMARRSIKPLEYSFQPIDQDKIFFSIRVVIGG